MNQELLKDILAGLAASPTEFSVVFSGKKSKKIAGLYYPEKQTIVINNRNFESETLLLTAAIHEYAHHLDYCTQGKTGHTKAFYSIHARLIQVARKNGVLDVQTAPMQDQLDEVRQLLAEHAAIERKIGEKLKALQTACIKAGVDFDLITDHELKIARKTRKRCLSVCDLKQLELFDGMTADQQEVIAKTPASIRAESMTMIADAPTVAAGEMAVADRPRKSADPDSPIVLRKEVQRIEKTIASLIDRKTHIEERLNSIDTGPVFSLSGGKVSEVPNGKSA